VSNLNNLSIQPWKDISAFSALAMTIIAFLTSVALCYLILKTTRFHGSFSFDSSEGIQKAHSGAVPRIGGAGVMAAMIMCSVLDAEFGLLTMILMASLPALLAGIAEDLTKRVTPRVRLAATAASGVLAFYLTGYHLTGIEIAPIDTILSVVWISVLFSAFAVAGVSNAYNIIDGYNGLAGITSLISFIAIASVAHSAGDLELAKISWVFAGAILGFLAFNWPKGRIFLGDGGSYSLGFAIGWLSIMLVERTSTISPFACLLISIYPITEILFSIYRRTSRNKKSTVADRLHLHSLFGRRYISRIFPNMSPKSKNSITGLGMSMISIPSGLIVQFIYESTLLCILAGASFVIFYLIAYRRITRFK
jgi:UDP-N-acetylmuramyl pentapeptide phosphotransferase/UDP-N-acetylglucosamine-1-phosphate transferase